MLHRHLNHEQLTLAAIDDIIAQGKPQDWAQLRSAALLELSVFEKIVRVCQAHAQDLYAQRYYFWENYAKKNLA